MKSFNQIKYVALGAALVYVFNAYSPVARAIDPAEMENELVKIAQEAEVIAPSDIMTYEPLVVESPVTDASRYVQENVAEENIEKRIKVNVTIELPGFPGSPQPIDDGPPRPPG